MKENWLDTKGEDRRDARKWLESILESPLLSFGGKQENVRTVDNRDSIFTQVLIHQAPARSRLVSVESISLLQLKYICKCCFRITKSVSTSGSFSERVLDLNRQ